MFCLLFSFKDRFQVCLSFIQMLTRSGSISSTLWTVTETKCSHSICWKFVKIFCHYLTLIICQDVLSLSHFNNLSYTYYKKLVTPTYKTFSISVLQYCFVSALCDECSV